MNIIFFVCLLIITLPFWKLICTGCCRRPSSSVIVHWHSEHQRGDCAHLWWLWHQHYIIQDPAIVCNDRSMCIDVLVVDTFYQWPQCCMFGCMWLIFGNIMKNFFTGFADESWRLPSPYSCSFKGDCSCVETWYQHISSL